MTQAPHRARVLFLSQCLPYPPTSGVTNRTFNVARQLQREFDVSLLAFSRPNHQPDAAARESSARSLGEHLSHVAEPVAIPSELSRVRKFWDHARSVGSGRPYTYYEYSSDRFSRRLRELVEQRQFDLIHMDSLDLYRWLSESGSTPTTCTHHSIESELLRLRAERTRSRVLARYIFHQADLVERVEREFAPKVASNVMMSDIDAQRLRKLAPGASTVVVPNGVDTSAFQPLEDSPSPGRVVFMGPTYMLPNRDAVEFLLDRIWDRVRGGRPNATLRLIGRNSAEETRAFESRPGVKCLGFVDDIRPHIAAATCFVVPLRVGGGTRLKILDAWALGKAIVSTSIGAEGLDVRDGENILIRDDPESFAEAICQVLSDEGLRRTLESGGRRTAVETFDWNVIGATIRDHYRQLLG